MKGKILASFIIALLLVTTACQNPLTLALSSQDGGLSLTASTSATSDSRSILPSGMTPAAYHLSGTGPSGATLSQDSTSGVFSVTNLAAGDWSLTVTGLDAAGSTTVSGSTTVTIAIGKTTTASLTLAPVSTGSGTLALTVDWSGATSFSVDSITGTLTPDSGSAVSLSFTISGTVATCTQASLATGSYMLSVAATKSGEQVSRTMTDTVLIYNGQTSSGTISLTDADCGYRVIYAIGTAESGSAPTDGNVYYSGALATISGNTGSCSKTNNAFVGWNTKSDGTGVSYAVGSTLTILGSNVYLYPKWGNVVYIANGAAKGSVPVDMTAYASGASVTVLANTGSLTRNGYVFSGWTTTADTGTVYSPYNANKTYTKTDGSTLTTFYARWTPCVSSVSACGEHTLIVTTSGSLYACGNNSVGQLCDGKTESVYMPVQVVPEGVRSAAGGYRYISSKIYGWSSVVFKDGTLKACGYNSEYAQLGTGDTSDKTSLTTISMPGGVSVASVSVGGRQVLALGSDGNYYACGDNTYGELGLGSSTPSYSSFTQGTTVTGLSAISAGLDFSAVLTSDGKLYAFGLDSYGQLGDGATSTQTAPVLVKNVSGVTAVSTGGPGGTAGFMLIVSGGSLWVCGYNAQGQLGNGGTGNVTTGPQQITTVSNVASVSAGPNFSLILTADGTLYACGSNAKGQFGNGTTSNSTVPTKVATNVVAASAGGFYVSSNCGYSMIVKTDGSLWASGDNTYGQLGDGKSSTSVSSWEQISF